MQIIIDSKDYFIIVSVGDKILGYMNFTFECDLRKNNFIFNDNHFMGLYIDTKCSFFKK